MLRADVLDAPAGHVNAVASMPLADKSINYCVICILYYLPQGYKFDKLA
jgi:hypothetical protein